MKQIVVPRPLLYVICAVLTAMPLMGIGAMPHYGTNNIVVVAAGNNEEWKYIEQFKDLAIREMHRVGIPASITLAQGMFESQYGDSPLALNANNHFGMKCKVEWKGDTFHYDDDLVGECFKKYPTVYDSYKDHSDHIKSRTWYFFLFALPQTDYIGWAIGLQKAGYATDTLYAQKLTALIERYGLHELDLIAQPQAEVLDGKEIAIDGENTGSIKRNYQERKRIENNSNDNNNDNRNQQYAQQPQSPFRNVAIGKSDLSSLNMAIGENIAPKAPTTDGEHRKLSGAPAVIVDPQQIENSIKRVNNESSITKAANPIRVGSVQDTPAETQVEYYQETPALDDRYTSPIQGNSNPIVAANNMPNNSNNDNAQRITDTPTMQKNMPIEQVAMKNQTIERNNTETATVNMVSKADNNPPKQPINIEVNYKKPVFENNCKSVTYEVPVMPEKIARMYDIELSLLLKYNHLQDKKQAFPANQPIYLSLPVLGQN